MADTGHLAFYTHSRSYYHTADSLPNGVIDEIMFGVYHEDGGCSGEGAIRWYELGGGTALRLELFDDGMLLLDRASDFLGALREACDNNRTPMCSDVERMLLASGFRDKTKTEDPDIKASVRDQDEYARQLRHCCERGREKGASKVTEQIAPILALLDERKELRRSLRWAVPRLWLAHCGDVVDGEPAPQDKSWDDIAAEGLERLRAEREQFARACDLLGLPPDPRDWPPFSERKNIDALCELARKHRLRMLAQP